MDDVQNAFERGSVQQVEANVFAFVGLPGSGKTTALDVAAEHGGEFAMTDKVSNYVHHCYRNEVGDELVDDNELGEWAAEQKAEHGNGYFVDRWAQLIKSDQQAQIELGGEPWDPIALDGVRSPEELDALRDHFTDVTCVVVWAKPDIRYERLEERDSMDRETFEERNERELHDWNALQFFTDSDYYDYIIPNNRRMLDSFERDVRLVMDGSPIMDSYKSSPFPDGLSDEHIPQYL